MEEWSNRKPINVIARDLSLGKRITLLSLRRTKQVLTDAEIIMKYVPRESALLDHMESFERVIAQFKLISVGKRTVKQFRALRQMIAEGAISRIDCRNLPRERQLRIGTVPPRQSGSLQDLIEYDFIAAKETYIHNHWLDNGYAEILGDKLLLATWRYTDENPWIFQEIESKGFAWEKTLDGYNNIVPRVSKHSNLQWVVDIYRYISDTYQDGITNEVRLAIQKVEMEKMRNTMTNHTYHLLEEPNATVLLAMNEELSDGGTADSCLSYIEANITDGDPFTNESRKSMTIAVLIDGGASINVITPEIVERLGIEKVKASLPTRIKNASGTVTECGYKCRVYITMQGEIIRDIWDKAIPYDSKNMTLGVDCTIMAGCPVSMILGSHAMKVFGILDDKSKKQTIMGNEEGKIVVNHMSDQAWMRCNKLTRSTLNTVNVILNQLDRDVAESNYRNSITFTPPTTHRLAVLVSLLKSTNLNKFSKNGSLCLGNLDANEISISSVRELAVKLQLTKSSLEALINEVEQFGKKEAETIIQEYKEASMASSVFKECKSSGTGDKQFEPIMGNSFVNMTSLANIISSKNEGS